MATTRTVLVLSVLVFAACRGQIADPPAAGGPDGDGPTYPRRPTDPPPTNPNPEVPRVTFTCDATAPLIPNELRRLTKHQYERTLEELAVSFSPANAGAIINAYQLALDQIPNDVTTKEEPYARMSQAVGQAHVDGYYAVARRFAEAAAEPGRLEDLLGACATDGDAGNDAACLEDFVRRAGRRSFRRPLSDDEVTFFVTEVYAANGIDPAGVSDLLVGLLIAPPALYLIEYGDQAVDGQPNARRLDDYEIATRLAYHFWQSTPDDALLDAAAAGRLTNDATYAEEVERVFADPRTRRAIDDFYVEWLGLDEIPDLTAFVDHPQMIAYAGEDLPTPLLRQHLIDDILDLLRHETWTTPGTFSDIFVTQRSFAKTDDVARLYGGVPLWTEGTEPPMLPAEQRAGLLTRPALLVNDQATTRPILRGALVRKRLLCDELELPANMMNVRFDPEEGARTTRERIEDLTEQPGSVCAGCHPYINPLGFASEQYDALGRHRDIERVYDFEGNLVAELPIDTSGVPQVAFGDDTMINDAIELSRLVGESPKAQACFARHYFAFTFGRHEDVTRDGCALEALRQRIESGATLAEILRSVALEPAFKTVEKGAEG